MSWSFTVPGQPVSWNHAYKSVIIKPRGKTAFRTQAKTEEANAYQLAVTLCCKAARPSDWQPAAQVRITYRLHLGRDIDADNTGKMLNDSIAKALGLDDSRFLPCFAAKEHGVSQPYVEVTIE